MKLIFSIVLSVLISSAYCQTRNKINQVGSIGAEVISDLDVYDFIEYTLLPDTFKGEVFNKSHQDIKAYKKALAHEMEVYFPKALRRLMYMKLLKYHALKVQQKAGKHRSFFNTTKEDLFHALQKREDEVLKALLDKGKGIKKARLEYGNFLKKHYFPHQVGESSADIYMRWYESEKKRLRNQFLIEESVEYEKYQIARGMTDKTKFSIELWDFYNNQKKLIERDLKGKVISSNEMNQFFHFYPESKLILKKIKHQTIANTNLNEYFKIHPNDKDIVFAGLHHHLSKGPKAIFKQWQSYEQKIHQLAMKYPKKAELEERRVKALGHYSGGGNYESLALSKLYEAAAAYKTFKKVGQKLVKRHKDSYFEIHKQLLGAIKSKHFLTNKHYAKMKLDQAVMAWLTEEWLDFNEVQSLYEESLLGLGLWFIQFETIKWVKDQKVKPQLELKTYGDAETIKLLKGHLLRKKHDENLKVFKHKTLKFYANILAINHHSVGTQSGLDAFKWIIGKDPAHQ